MTSQEARDQREDALVVWPAWGLKPTWEHKLNLMIQRTVRKRVRAWFDKNFPLEPKENAS